MLTTIHTEERSNGNGSKRHAQYKSSPAEMGKRILPNALLERGFNV